MQINTGDSRIDFKLENISSVVTVELEKKVGQVLNENDTLKSYYIAQQEFQQCSDLLRTLVAKRIIRGKTTNASMCDSTCLSFLISYINLNKTCRRLIFHAFLR